MKSFVVHFSDYQSMTSNLMGRKRITTVFEGNNVKIMAIIFKGQLISKCPYEKPRQIEYGGTEQTQRV